MTYKVDCSFLPETARNLSSMLPSSFYFYHSRALGRSENPGVPVIIWWHNLPLLVEIVFTDPPESGGATMACTPGDDRPAQCVLMFIFHFYTHAYFESIIIQKGSSDIHIIENNQFGSSGFLLHSNYLFQFIKSDWNLQ